MKTNKKHDQKMKNVPESNQEIEDQVATPISRRTLLKTTMAASAASLAILGAAETPVQAKTETPVPTPRENQDDLALKEYFRRDYNYCDAKILAGFWGGSPYEAKVRMGSTLLNKRQEQAERYIREARGLALEKTVFRSGQGYGYLNFPINYHEDGGYTFDDAEALSKYWKQQLGETKLLMETMLVSGKDKDIQAALKNAKG